MCFSMAASVAAGTILLPGGGYCVAKAARHRKRYLALAAVPIFFGIQQLSEGLVWFGIGHGDPFLTRVGSLIFLFFALAWWPFWFPLMTAIMEPPSRLRKAASVLALVAVSWFWILYVPILTGPDSVLQTLIVQHSIVYDYHGLAIYHYVPRGLLRILYFLCVALPMVCARTGLGRVPGLFFAGSAIVALGIYDYAFISVWCFFAAILSTYICWVLAQLPASDPSRENA